MRFKRVLIWLSALSLLTFVACGDDASKKTNNGSGNNGNNANNANNITINNGGNNGVGDDLADLITDAACEAAFECASPFLTPILGRYNSATDCKNDDNLSLFGDIDTSELGRAIEDGRVTLNDSLLNSCLNQLKDGLCQGTFEVESPECEAIVTGNVAEGGNCVESQECADGRDCRTVADECYGTCEPNCGEENCSSDQYCQNGETCAARISEGGTCQGFDSCAQGLYCRDETCTSGGDVAIGGTCDDTRDCSSGSCIGDACVQVNSVGMGQACDVPFGDQGEGPINLCQAGTVCTNLMISQQGVSGTCGTPKLQGGECNYFGECAIGLTCDAEDPIEGGNCVPTYADGESCGADFDCQSNSCPDGICEAQTQQEACVLP